MFAFGRRGVRNGRTFQGMGRGAGKNGTEWDKIKKSHW